MLSFQYDAVTVVAVVIVIVATAIIDASLYPLHLIQLTNDLRDTYQK